MIKTELQPELVFKGDTHEYFWGGEWVPGVNYILQSVGIIEPFKGDPWYAHRGTVVHLVCQYYDEGTLDESTVDSSLIGYLEGWKKFRADENVEPGEIEVAQYSIVHRFAGRPDRGKAMRRGKRATIDLKSRRPKRQDGIAIAGYSLFDPVESERIVVGLNSDGTYEMRIFKDEGDIEVFLAAARVVRYKEEFRRH